jgi:hypothetical protein
MGEASHQVSRNSIMPTIASRSPLSGRRRWKGQALVIVLSLALVVYLLGVSTVVATFRGFFFSVHSGSATKAQSVAEAASDFALTVLNSTVPVGAQSDLAALPAFFAAAGGGPWVYADGANGHFFRDRFEGVVPSLSIEVPATVPVPGGSGTAADYRIVRAQAEVSGALRRMEVIARLDRSNVGDRRYLFSRALLT